LDLFGRVDAPRRSIYAYLALLYQGQSQLALNRPADAIPILENLVKSAPAEPYITEAALIELGYAREMAGQCEQAVAAFDRAARLAGPREEDAILGKARCNAVIGRTEEALQAYRDYLANFPGSSRVTEINIRMEELKAKTAEKPQEGEKER
jgi:tetratricopeptide (TPR) repeat protein